MVSAIESSFNTEYASFEVLKSKARKRIPGFVFDYLEGGCNEEVNLAKNPAHIREVELKPRYLDGFSGASTQTELFGHTYDAPFGIAPVGLQGLMWPKAPEILAKAAFDHNIPFILSTVTSSSIEKISEITEGRAWFQLYHPTEISIRDDILKRAGAAQCPVLVLTCDLPAAAFRPRDIRNGLDMPPKMSLRNIMQIIGKPVWALETLKTGRLEFANLQPYMPGKLSLKETGAFMDANLETRMDVDKIAAIRDIWKGRIVLKGVTTEADTKIAIGLGVDGIIVSNHGGRQLDVGESTLRPMVRIAKKYGDQVKVMMDSGISSGPDIARSLASGAEFTFLGRSFMYSVCALGNKGGDHATLLLKTQLQQIMEQVGCASIGDFPAHLVQD